MMLSSLSWGMWNEQYESLSVNQHQSSNNIPCKREKKNIANAARRKTSRMESVHIQVMKRLLNQSSASRIEKIGMKMLVNESFNQFPSLSLEDAVRKCLPKETIQATNAFNALNFCQNHVNWNQLPPSCHPRGGNLPEDRVDKKVVQVETICLLAIALILRWKADNAHLQRKMRVVEFCAGSGFIAIPIAMIFPQDVEVFIVDRKGGSIDIAKERVAAIQPYDSMICERIHIREEDINDFQDSFDLGIALHACGGATDISLQKCIEQKASIILCPCCVGKILFHRTQPLSHYYKPLLSSLEYKHILKAADTVNVHSNTTSNKINSISNGSSSWKKKNELSNAWSCDSMQEGECVDETIEASEVVGSNNTTEWCRLCKLFVEDDRRHHILESFTCSSSSSQEEEEMKQKETMQRMMGKHIMEGRHHHGYESFLTSMKEDAGPKHDLIVAYCK